MQLTFDGSIVKKSQEHDATSADRAPYAHACESAGERLRCEIAPQVHDPADAVGGPHETALSGAVLDDYDAQRSCAAPQLSSHAGAER